MIFARGSSDICPTRFVSYTANDEVIYNSSVLFGGTASFMYTNPDGRSSQAIVNGWSLFSDFLNSYNGSYLNVSGQTYKASIDYQEVHCTTFFTFISHFSINLCFLN